MRFSLPNGQPDWPLEEVDATEKLQAELRKLKVDENKVRELSDRLRAAVYAQRDEILKAFIAKYGCMPDEAVQCEQSTPHGYRWYVRKKTEEEMNTGEILS